MDVFVCIRGRRPECVSMRMRLCANEVWLFWQMFMTWQYAKK